MLTQAFAIEVHGRSAGIAVADRGGFVFFAADHACRTLDRRVFQRVGQVERAVRLLPGTRTRSGEGGWR